MTTFRKVFLFCLITEIIFLLSAFFLPVIDQFMIFKEESVSFTIINGVIFNCIPEPGSSVNIYFQSAVYLVRDLILSYLLLQAKSIFSSLRKGGWFHGNGNGVIYKIGLGFISLSVFLFVSDLFLVNIQHDGKFITYYQLDNLMYIPIGCAIVVLGYVLKISNSINEEQKLII